VVSSYPVSYSFVSFMISIFYFPFHSGFPVVEGIEWDMYFFL
jgi:hypothetical protein